MKIPFAHHLAQAASSQPDPEVLADELLNSTGDLASAGEVHAFLGNVVKLRARRLIDRKDAVAFGYLSQLLLCSLSGMEKLSTEERDAQALDEVNEDIRKMRASFLANYASRQAAKAAKNLRAIRPREQKTLEVQHPNLCRTTLQLRPSPTLLNHRAITSAFAPERA